MNRRNIIAIDAKTELTLVNPFINITVITEKIKAVIRYVLDNWGLLYNKYPITLEASDNNSQYSSIKSGSSKKTIAKILI